MAINLQPPSPHFNFIKQRAHDKFTFLFKLLPLIKRSIAWLLVTLIAGQPLWSQIDVTQVMPVDPNIRIGRLANGLTYYIRRNGLPQKRVELRLVVNAGSVLETEEQVGLAHFMEHMNFNGTKRFPKNELLSYLQSIGVKIGADLNAYTSFDETVYILPVPSDKPGLVEKGLQILEDWAHNATLDPVEVEKERGVVIEEWRVGRGADERMMRQTLPVQYRGSIYAERLPIGNKNALEHFSYDQLKKFYQDWYRPDLQAVIAVGDIDVNEIEQQIKNIFSNIAAPVSPKPRISYEVPDHPVSLSVVAKDRETAFPSVTMMYKKEPLEEVTIGDYSKYMNRRLFIGMLNNRLRELALGPAPPFLQASSSYGKSLARTKDAFQLYANTSDTGMAGTVAALMRENRRVLLYGFTPGEFELQKKQLQSQYDRIFSEREKEESYKYVNEYINNFLFNEPIPGIEWEYDFVKQYLRNVKLDEVNQIAQSWITRDNMVVTLNAPDKPGVKIPSPDEVDEILAQAEQASPAPYQETSTAASLLDPASIKPGKIKLKQLNEDLQTTTLHLSNGATVILKSTNFKNDEILFRAFSKGGHSLVSDSDYHSALNAAAIVAQSGVGNFTAVELDKILKGKNTQVLPSIGLYSEGLNGNTTPADAETLLQLVYLYFNSPRKDNTAFESYKTRQKQLYANLSANPQIYFSSEYQKLMTQDHPRAGGLPKPEDFDKINLDRSIKIFKERFSNAADFTFFLVGAFDEATIQPLIEKYIGSLPGKPGKENFRDLGIRPPEGKVEKVFIKGEEQLGFVNMSFITPAPYSVKDAFVIKSLGELMTMKLLSQLREEKSSIYGIRATGNLAKYPYSYSNFNINFPCAPENADTLSVATLEEIRQIIRSGVNADDLAKIKEQQKRKLETDLHQNIYWITSLHDSYYLGNDPLEILQRQKMIDALTGKMIQDAAKKYLNLDNYVRAVLKPGTNDKAKPF
jgi:zinc protease